MASAPGACDLAFAATAGISRNRNDKDSTTMTQRIDYQQQSPELFKKFVEFNMTLKKGAIEETIVDLVSVRASQINGCAFCVDMHTADARKGGETDRRLATVVVWRETPFFTARERAALEWTEAVTLVSENHVPDAVWEAVKPHFSEAELVDLTLLISAINAWNRFAISFRKTPA